MDPLSAIGRIAVEQWWRRFYLIAVAATVLLVALRPRNWPRTVRDVFARQILFTGIEAVAFVSHIAFWVGLTLVVQARLWTGRLGQSNLLGPILVTFLIRELGPVLANLVVIGRSGNAIAAELGHMKISGEVRVLDAQGLDPMIYLVMPRVLGMMVSVFCLTVVFVAVSLFSGYFFGWLLGARNTGFGQFVESVASAVGPVDLLSGLAKTVIPAMLSATIACTEGLSVAPTITDVPRATTRSLQRSILALFFVAAIISAISYL